MLCDISKSALALAALLGLGTMPIAAQRTDADTARGVQGYAPDARERAPSNAELAASDPSVMGGAIALPTRSEAEVEQDIRTAQQALARADSELTHATARRAKTAELIRTRQRQLAELEAKKNQADKEKRKADKKSLEAEKKAVERRKSLAEGLAALNDAEIGAARKAREAAIANQQALELERMLVGKRAERASVGAAVLRELERQTLAAQKKATGLNNELAGKRDLVASKRLDLYRAYLESLGKGT
jgi:chromosome segregation ATPase